MYQQVKNKPRKLYFKGNFPLERHACTVRLKLTFIKSLSGAKGFVNDFWCKRKKKPVKLTLLFSGYRSSTEALLGRQIKEQNRQQIPFL